MAEPYHPMLRRRSSLGAAEETTHGTNVLSSITGPISTSKIFNARMELLEVYDGGEVRPASAFGGTTTSQVVSKRARLTFQMELSHGCAFLTLLTGCGMASTPKVFVTDMSSKKTWSFKLWQDGSLKQMFGASGTVVVTIERGKTAIADFTWDGIWEDPATDAALPTESLPSTLAFPCKSVAHTVDAAVPPRWNRIAIDLGAKVVGVKSGAAASGYAYFAVADRSPTIDVDYEGRKKADLSAHTLVTTATEVALVIPLTDGTNTLTFTAPKGQRISIGDQDRDEFITNPIRWQLNRSTSGNDELSIAASA